MKLNTDIPTKNRILQQAQIDSTEHTEKNVVTDNKIIQSIPVTIASLSDDIFEMEAEVTTETEVVKEISPLEIGKSMTTSVNKETDKEISSNEGGTVEAEPAQFETVGRCESEQIIFHETAVPEVTVQSRIQGTVQNSGEVHFSRTPTLSAIAVSPPQFDIRIGIGNILYKK